MGSGGFSPFKIERSLSPIPFKPPQPHLPSTDPTPNSVKALFHHHISSLIQSSKAKLAHRQTLQKLNDVLAQGIQLKVAKEAELMQSAERGAKEHEQRKEMKML